MRLVKAYGQIWARLSKQLAALTAQIADARQRGELINPAWLYRQERYQSLLAQISKEIARFAEFAEVTITNEQGQAVRAALRDSQKLLTVAAEEQGISASFNRLNPAAVENQIGFLSNGSPLSSLLGQLPNAARQRVEQELFPRS